MSKNKFFRYAYPKKQNSKLHDQRDADSFIQLMSLLMEKKGYEYGGLFLNYASGNGSKIVGSESFSPQRGSVIVLTTRPPLDDEEEGPHLVIGRSGTQLEDDILDSLRQFLPTCSRREIILNPSFEDKFEPRFEDRISIQFAGHGKNRGHLNFARYQSTVDKRKKIREWKNKDDIRTAAYLIYTDEVWGGGPDLLVSFGMTGTASLIWAHLIRTKYPYLLDNYRIAVAEMIIGDFPDVPFDLSFSEKWKVELILNHEL